MNRKERVLGLSRGTTFREHNIVVVRIAGMDNNRGLAHGKLPVVNMLVVTCGSSLNYYDET
jgi:hypothetical protein